MFGVDAKCVGAAAGCAALALYAWRRCGAREVKYPEDPIGVRLVCISDTHGRHRDVEIPEGDILIHAGDYTHFGKERDARDLNAWFGELLAAKRVRHIVIVNGNHEVNADWMDDNVSSLLSNAVFLRDSAETFTLPGTAEAPPKTVKIYGTEFHWPISSDSPCNPYEGVAPDADVVVVHGPPKGFNDGKKGCALLAKTVAAARPRLVVSGHIHFAHGRAVDAAGTTYVNAAMCRREYSIGWHPQVVVV